MKRKIFAGLIIIFMFVPFGAYAATATLQPSPGLNDGTDDGSATRGKDTGNYPWNVNLNFNQDANFGAAEEMRLYNSTCDILGNLNPGYLQFSLAGMPTQNITSARIEVYARVYFNGAGGPPWAPGTYQVSVRRITSAWDEMAVTFNTRPSYDPTIIGSTTLTLLGGTTLPVYEFQGYLSFDITDLYKGWAASSFPNYGVALVFDGPPNCPNGKEFLISTSDQAEDPARRPRLIVEYGSPCDQEFCYEITYTNLDNPEDVTVALTNFCFNFEEHSGKFGTWNLSLFFDSMNKQAVAYGVSAGVPVAYLKFHGDQLNVVKGIYNFYGIRWQIRGHKVASESCPGI